jgi:O-antigen/teichoic acid export membrane protein
VSRRGVAWAGAVNLVGGAAGSLLGLALAAVVGRSLGTDGAGTYFLVVAVFLIVSSITELGADTGLVRYIAALRATDRVREAPGLLRVALGPVLVAGLVVVAASAGIAVAWPELVDGLPLPFVVLAAALAATSSLVAVLLSATRGYGDVLAYPLLQNIALPVLRLVGVAVAVVAGAGATGVLVAWMAPLPLVLVLAAAVVVRLVRRHGGRWRGTVEKTVERRALRREFWGFSAARGFAAAVEILLEWADVLLVGALASPEAAGVYAVVTRCARASEVVHQAARVAIGPQLSAALARGDLHQAREVYGLVTAAMIWLAWPFFLLLALFGDTVLGLFGPGFGDGAVPLAVLSLAMALATAAGTVQTILLMGGRSSWQLADKTGALVLNVLLNLVLIPQWGITGAAVAWAATIIADTAVVVWQAQQLMGMRPSGREPVIAAALSLVVVGSVAVAARVLLGSSVPVLLGTVAVAGAAHLAVGWGLRERLGVPRLLRLRAA